MTDDSKTHPAAPSLSEEEMRRIADKLAEVGVRTSCPMCNTQNSWVLADGYLNEPIQGGLHQGLVIGGPSIPSAALICSNCGFMSQHALGALGLLEHPPEEEG